MARQVRPPAPRERYREVLRRTILDVAREAFVRDGYEGVSMRKVAEKVGCSHGNLYLHFKDKEALFDTLVEESFEQLAHGLRARPGGAPIEDPVELVRKAGRAYVAFGLANPSAYEFAFILRRPGQERPYKPHGAYDLLRSVVQRCLDAKRFRPMNVEVAAQALWAAAHGITSLFIRRPYFPWGDREQLIGQVIDAAVDGLLA